MGKKKATKATQPDQPAPENKPVNVAKAADKVADKTADKAAKPAKAGKPAKPQEPPANPFGKVLPNAEQQGSPADKNWQPKGDPVTDISTLEAQERYLYRLMVRAKAERDMAKAEAKLILCQAEETSVTDGFRVDQKQSLHRKADVSDRRAAKAEKDYKRSREGWNAVKGTLHRYLTEDDPPLFTRGQ